jgi:hypothetical protein
MPEGRTSSACTGIVIFIFIVLTLLGFFFILVLLHLRSQRSPQRKLNFASFGCAFAYGMNLPKTDARLEVFPVAFQRRRIR